MSWLATAHRNWRPNCPAILGLISPDMVLYGTNSCMPAIRNTLVGTLRLPVLAAMSNRHSILLTSFTGVHCLVCNSAVALLSRSDLASAVITALIYSAWCDWSPVKGGWSAARPDIHDDTSHSWGWVNLLFPYESVSAWFLGLDDYPWCPCSGSGVKPLASLFFLYWTDSIPFSWQRRWKQLVFVR